MGPGARWGSRSSRGPLSCSSVSVPTLRHHPRLPSLTIALGALLVTASAAFAVERTVVAHGDRITDATSADVPLQEYLIECVRDAQLDVRVRRQKGARGFPLADLYDAQYVRTDHLRFARPLSQYHIRTNPLAEGGLQRIVAGLNDASGGGAERLFGTIDVTVKVKPDRKFTLRGKATDEEPPTELVFGAYDGYEANVSLSWKGDEPVTITSFTGPEGADLVSAKTAKTKRTSFKQNGFAITSAGDQRIVLNVPPGTTKWSLKVKLKGTLPDGAERDLRPAPGEKESHLDLRFALFPRSNAVVPLVFIRDEDGAGNDVVWSAANAIPEPLWIAGQTPDCQYVITDLDGDPPTSYRLTCNEETTTALVHDVLFDGQGSVASYTVDPLQSPQGGGTVTLSNFTYNAAGIAVGYTEVRTFDGTGHTHTLVIQDLVAYASGAFSYTVIHTDAEGVERRHEFLPLQ